MSRIPLSDESAEIDEDVVDEETATVEDEFSELDFAKDTVTQYIPDTVEDEDDDDEDLWEGYEEWAQDELERDLS